jgi:hypothetical protein
MSYNYRLSNIQANFGIPYRMIQGVRILGDRWLVTEERLVLSPQEQQLVEERLDAPPVIKEAAAVVVDEKTSLKKTLLSRGFPEEELIGLSKTKLRKMLELDIELTEASNGE